MHYPASPFMVLYNAYRIVRQGEPAGESPGGSLYYVQRPDGSECCRDATWAESERIIRQDLAATQWPPDSLPPELAAELNSTRRIPPSPTPAAKPKRARARPATGRR
jgi:Uma2 family endonuclease